MNKKLTLLGIAFFTLMGGMSIVSCNNNSANHQATKAETGKLVTPSGKAITVAYITMDSISKNYQYAIDVREKLSKDAQDGRAQLESKVNAFQSAAQDFQRKVKINAFVNQQAAEVAQAKVLKLQQEAQQLESTLQQQMAQKQIILLQDMNKEIETQMKAFNKDGRYNLILTSSGMNNIMYADKSMDITEDFLKFLNENYKNSTVEKDSKPADKK